MKNVWLAAGLIFCTTARAEIVEVFVPVFVEHEYQSDQFIYIDSKQSAAAPAEPRMQKYRVLPKDSLYNISRKLFGSEKKWKMLYDNNRDLISDPEVIEPGLVLSYPSETTPPAPPPHAATRTGMIEAEKILETLDKWLLPEKVQQLRSSIIHQDGKSLLPFSSFTSSQLGFEFDESHVEVHITLPPEFRKARVLIMHGLGLKASTEELTKPADFSSFLNVSALGDYEQNNPNVSPGVQPFGSGFSGAFNYKSYVLEYDASYHDRSPDPSNFERQDTRLVKDFPDKMLRTMAGDLVYPTSYFQEYQPMAGFGATTQFTLQPYRLVVPSGNRTFYLKSPSVVTVIRNGERMQSYNLPAGAHNISELPVSAGINHITLEIRDDMGHVENIDIPVNIASLSLAKGTHQITYNAGIESTPTTYSLDYDAQRPAFSAFHRYGLTNSLTVGASFQGDQDQQGEGAEALLSTALGSFQLDVGHSYLSGFGGDVATRLLYNYDDNRNTNKSYRSIEASVEWDGPGFTRLGDAEPDSIAAWTYEITYSQQLTDKLSSSLGLEYMVNRTTDPIYSDSWQVLFSLSETFNERWYGNFTMTYGRSDLGNLETTFHTFLIYTFPTSRQSVSVTSEVDHTDNGNLQDLRGEYRFNSGGKGRRLDIVAGVDDENTTINNDLHVNATGNRGQVSLVQYSLGAIGGPVQLSTQVTAATGIAYADHHWTWGQPVIDSFAIVPAASQWQDQSFDINPGPDDTWDARTNSWGPGMVPSLISYQYATVRLDNAQLKEGYTFDKNTYVVLPTYKSGYMIKPGTEATVVAAGRLVDEHGEPVVLVAGRFSVAGKPESGGDFFTNKEGEFSVEGLKAGKYQLHINEHQFTDIEVTIPESASGRYDAGRLVVKESGKE